MAHVHFDPYEDRGNDADCARCRSSSRTLHPWRSPRLRNRMRGATWTYSSWCCTVFRCGCLRTHLAALHWPLLLSCPSTQVGLALFLESPLLKVIKTCLQRLTQRNGKAIASSDTMAKAVFKVNAARALKVRRVSKKESKVTFDDLGKELPSTSRRDSSGQLEGP